MSLLARLQEPETRSEIPCPAGPETDLWVLAGQSNMQGVGILREKFPPSDRIWSFDMTNEWIKAEEPLHRLYASRFAAHRLINNMSPEQQATNWAAMLALPDDVTLRCVGPGLPFARHLAEHIDQPIGLIPTAHGGTSMEQWSPAKKDQGTDSLYGAMLERIRLARAGGKGGRLRGILWYQGESEAGDPVVRHDDGTTEPLAVVFERKWLGFVDAVRRDTGVADLPIIYVQLGRFTPVGWPSGPAWEIIREGQRVAATKRPNLYVVSATDLPLDDIIHIGWDGQQRLGRRLAEVALTKVYGRQGHAQPIELESIEHIGPEPKVEGEKFRLKVKYRNVNGRMRAAGEPWGFELRRPPAKPGELTHGINRVGLDPSDPTAVILEIGPPWVKNSSLVYGPGLDPFVNIVDEMDMPVPAFGPLPVPDPRE